jgi:formylglycine-generating enzyme required for sulfatase activity
MVRQYIMNCLRSLVLLFVTVGLGGCLFDESPEGMVLIPGGYFVMGDDRIDKEGHAFALGLEKPWFADESPQRQVSLPGFYIDKYEVSNKEYYIFCQATDCKSPKFWKGAKYPEGKDNYPVTGISFFQAAAFAQWNGKRLPTEKEWEKAARGPNGLSYPWGDRFDASAANISQSNRKKRGQGLKPRGSYENGKSPFGVHDMIGNAWEWVWDYYLPYPDNEFESKDYGDKYTVVRGLSYFGVGHFPKKEYMKVISLKARASYREKMNPRSYKIDVGFRCAMERPPMTKRIFDSLVG